jgi:hypothetical protein
VTAASAIAYLYASTLSFYLSRAVHHPGEVLREAKQTVAEGESDSGMLGRIVKGTLKAVKRRLSGAGRQDRVTLPEIDYRRYDAVSLHRRPRPRMQPKTVSAVQTEAATPVNVVSLRRAQGM